MPMPTPEAQAIRAQWRESLMYFIMPVLTFLMVIGVFVSYDRQVARLEDKLASQNGAMIEVFRDRNERLDTQNKLLHDVKTGQDVNSFRLRRIEEYIGIPLQPQRKAEKPKDEPKP
jgi:hypothetical protein